ncbi:MAG: hypothetical protein LBH70_08315, partial [Spirochaetaceae bacterium]|nr:hypothetical protein [Spirochaetaceae bacterium]
MPEALYADRIGIYFVNTKKPENRTVEEQPSGKTPDKTHFGHRAGTLGCELIPAGSPQATGVLNACGGTPQSRLPVWLAINGITAMKQANAALPRFAMKGNSNRWNKEYFPPPNAGIVSNAGNSSGVNPRK